MLEAPTSFANEFSHSSKTAVALAGETPGTAASISTLTSVRIFLERSMSGVLRGFRALVIALAGAVLAALLCLCVCFCVPDIVMIDPHVSHTSFTDAVDSLMDPVVLFAMAVVGRLFVEPYSALAYPTVLAIEYLGRCLPIQSTR